MGSDWAERKPLYIQVRDTLAARIATGTWKPGSPIPNEQDLARELGVSPGTMRKALDLLEAERVVTRRQGRGTYVNDPASEELAARFNNFRDANGKRIVGVAKTLDIAEAPATELERERLQLSTGDARLSLTSNTHPPGSDLHGRGHIIAGSLVPWPPPKRTKPTR